MKKQDNTLAIGSEFSEDIPKCQNVPVTLF